jgi:phenylalanyl-tRNA synthetase beta chain
MRRTREGHLPLPDEGGDRRRHAGCRAAFRGPPDPWREERPSPEWLQDRLRAIGLRPISALVDITNFFTYDMNRPLHVFDADKVHGTCACIARKGGETLRRWTRRPTPSRPATR